LVKLTKQIIIYLDYIFISLPNRKAFLFYILKWYFVDNSQKILIKQDKYSTNRLSLHQIKITFAPV
jgi:hypothetical protein